MKTHLILAIFSFASPLWALHSPSVRQAAIALWQASLQPGGGEVAAGQRPIKCGTWMHQILREDMDALPLEVQTAYRRSALGKAKVVQSQKSLSLLSGKFVIQYDTSGADAVPDSDGLSWSSAAGFQSGADGISDYVQFVAEAADSSYRYEVLRLGYPFSASSIILRMRNLGNYYGYALPGTDSLEIDNDLGFFDPDSVDIRGEYGVTVAHEFFHRLQFDYTTNFNFFHEPSAVWMEDKVFPQVNDYLQYLKSTYDGNESNIFAFPNSSVDEFNSFAPGNYDKVVWPKFLDERYSPDVIRHAWEVYAVILPTANVHNTTVQVFESALKQYDSSLSFSGAFAEFGRWMFYTGGRSLLAPSFADAALWPQVSMDTLHVASFVAGETLGLAPLSLNYQRLPDRLGRGVGFQLRATTDSLSVWPLYKDSGGIWIDSLVLTTPQITTLTGWEGNVWPEEYLHLFNFRAVNRTLQYVLLDSIFIFKKGQVLSGILDSDVSYRLEFLQDFSILLKDSIGNFSPAGHALLTLITKNGVLADSMSPSLSGVRNTLLLYQIGVDRALDALVSQGVLKLSVEMADSMNTYVNFSVFAQLTQGEGACAALRTGGKFELDFGILRRFFPAGDSTKLFYLYSTGIRTIFTASVFPIPVYRSDQSIYIVYQNPDSLKSHCTLYTLSGSLIKSLSSEKPGEHLRGEGDQNLYHWDLKNKGGRRVDPGIYLYYLNRAGESPLMGKIAVVGASRPSP